jgi:hypothetical protein
MLEIQNGTYSYGERSRLDFNSITDLLGLPEIYALEKTYGRPNSISTAEPALRN